MNTPVTREENHRKMIRDGRPNTEHARGEKATRGSEKRVEIYTYLRYATFKVPLFPFLGVEIQVSKLNSFYF